tara:strand:+ start:35 stop:1162 length:1128 start_codon:yes stop_codon:yes gene_type:complete
MPDIRKYFPNSKVSDWTGGSFGGAGGLSFYGEGGNVNIYEDPAGDLWISHEITATGNFTIKEGSGNIDYCIVAGGGGGGGQPYPPTPWGVHCYGGGGAGGYGEWTDQPVSATGGPGGNGVYPIVIGAGGTAAPPNYSAPGNDSSAFGNTRHGGGTGATAPTGNTGKPYNTAAGDGGSGGGATYNQWGWSPGPGLVTIGTGNSPAQSSPGAPVQGYPGGTASGTYGAYGRGMGGGGGGGAGATGGNGWSGPWSLLGQPTYANYGVGLGGNGGTGKANVFKTGVSTYYAGGGGGSGTGQVGLNHPNFGGGSGGSGGGGGGQASPAPRPHQPWTAGPAADQWAASSGTANTGGGGGANASTNYAGAGGSGVVIIRYKA